MKTKHRLSTILVFLLLAVLACNIPGCGGYANNLPDGLVEDYTINIDAGTLESYTYSADQLATRQAHGDPTRFTIVFGETSRQETWMYDTSGYQAVFVDGVKISERTTTPAYQEGMYATTYTPDIFYHGMGLDEAIAASGQQDFVLTSLDDLVEDGRLLHVAGLSVGVVDDQVRFVETLPATTETSLAPEDFSGVSP
jgi:hypothetical protein